MLTKIDASGRKFSVNKAYIPANKLSAADKATAQTHIDSVAAQAEKFSLASHFNDPWPDALDPLYKVTGDETQAAFLLSGLVEDVLIRSPEEWLCTKTPFTKRSFETNFYWKK